MDTISILLIKTEYQRREAGNAKPSLYNFNEIFIFVALLLLFELDCQQQCRAREQSNSKKDIFPVDYLG